MRKTKYQSNELNDSFHSEDVLTRVGLGDIQAVKECIDRYDNLIWKICGKYLRNQADREDTVQDIFIDIWKCAARFDSTKSSEIAFIILIARRRIIDRLRKLYRQSEIPLFEFALDNRLISNDHQRLYRLVNETSALETLDKLKPTQKQIINMTVFEGMSHSEIAETIGLPIGTVKTNIRRGFQKIRQSIKRANLLPIQIQN